MACRGVCSSLDEDTFHGLPRVVGVGTRHAVHLMLPTDGVTVLFASDGQEHRGAYVLEADAGLTLPVLPRTPYCPQVQVVTLTIFPKSTHLLVVGERRRKVVRVQVLAGEHVREPHRLSTAHWEPARAPALGAAANPPVTIGIVRRLHAGYRLLAAAGSVFDVVRVQPHSVVGVQQLQHRPAGHEPGAGLGRATAPHREHQQQPKQRRCPAAARGPRVPRRGAGGRRGGGRPRPRQVLAVWSLGVRLAWGARSQEESTLSWTWLVLHSVVCLPFLSGLFIC